VRGSDKASAGSATQGTRKKQTARDAKGRKTTAVKQSSDSAAVLVRSRKTLVTAAPSVIKDSSSVISDIANLEGSVRAPMPTAIHPMLATPVAKPFDSPDWLFEIKWDGYRAVAFIRGGKVRLVSRNQNDLTSQYEELSSLPEFVKASKAVIDGEIVALDEEGRPSFSLMQQKTGFRPGKHPLPGRAGIPILYYAFDLIYVDGYDLHRVNLEQRKKTLASLISTGDLVRYSDHYAANGQVLFEVARERGLEGIVAKRRNSCYEERRSREWLKIKITQTVDCVIGGYTEPEGSREYFGSIVLGLYDKQGRLIHVGQAGTGFDQNTLREMWKKLKEQETDRNPFHGRVEAGRRLHWLKPELVAEIKFSEWTHETSDGGLKLRAPVFLGLRQDKAPKECTLEGQIAAVSS
jgi:bifunctional non-homologous end joining protein LigD